MAKFEHYTSATGFIEVATGRWFSDLHIAANRRRAFREATPEEQAEKGHDFQVSASPIQGSLAQAEQIQELRNQVDQLQKENQEQEERWNDRDALKARYDELGKSVQTLEGDGSIQNPFKNWKIGMSVETGKWYFVPDPEDPEHPFLWEAIADGTPEWEYDRNYFDVVE